MKNLPYSVRIHKSNQREAERWCRENLGKPWSVTDNREGIWCCFWVGFRSAFPGYIFHFENEQDMIWVALRWQ